MSICTWKPTLVHYRFLIYTHKRQYLLCHYFSGPLVVAQVDRYTYIILILL